MKNAPVRILATKEIRDELKKLAIFNDRTMQAMMREMIKQYKNNSNMV